MQTCPYMTFTPNCSVSWNKIFLHISVEVYKVQPPLTAQLTFFMRLLFCYWLTAPEVHLQNMISDSITSRLYPVYCNYCLNSWAMSKKARFVRSQSPQSNLISPSLNPSKHNKVLSGHGDLDLWTSVPDLKKINSPKGVPEMSCHQVWESLMMEGKPANIMPPGASVASAESWKHNHRLAWLRNGTKQPVHVSPNIYLQ